MADIILAIGSIGTLIGAFYVYRTMKADHDWRRRQYALDLSKEWNPNTAHHWREIENIFPHLRDVDKTSGEITELTKTQAKELYTCSAEDNGKWTVRFHLIELINYYDHLAMAYTNNVGDQQIMEDAFKAPMIKAHDILKNFIEVVETCEGYLPWGPYIQVVEEWKSVDKQHRAKTA